MTIYEPYTAVTEQFTFPSAVTGLPTVTVTYDWGDVIVDGGASTSVAGNVYQYVVSDDLVNSFGAYRVKWSAVIGAATKNFYSTFNVERSYSNEDDFVINFPDYSSFDTNDYVRAERYARKTIESYVGQNFQFIQEKSMTLDGTGRESLALPYRLLDFSEVLIGEEDVTALVEIDPASKRFLRFIEYVDDVGASSSSSFGDGAIVTINGNWGWYGVPPNVVDATELLMVDFLDDPKREHKRYGIQRIWQDTNRLEFASNIFEGSTGNLDVDAILIDYIYWTPDMV